MIFEKILVTGTYTWISFVNHSVFCWWKLFVDIISISSGIRRIGGTSLAKALLRYFQQ